MTKKIRNITTVVGSKELKREQQRLESSGYVGLPKVFNTSDVSPDVPSYTWNNAVSSQLYGSDDYGNNKRPSVLFASSGTVVPCQNCGTPSLGYMNWGSNNKLPNVIALLTGMLSYTAIGWKMNTDIVSGLGPQAMYHYTQYVAGNITEKNIPYETAGILIKGLIGDLKLKLVNVYTNSPGTGVFASTSDKDAKTSINKYVADINDQIAKLEKDYEIWQTTNNELNDFKNRNNIARISLSLAGDQQMFGICFPEIELNQKQLAPDGNQVETSMWKPKVVRINYRPAHTCRLEQMDDSGKINYVYVSNRWFDNPYSVQGKVNNDIAAIPALSTFSAIGDLQDAILNARMSNVSVENRPTRFIIPCYYPTVGRPYYPVKEWHSIFGDCIYEYAATMISDRFNRKKNSNVIGRLIYINSDYMKQLFTENNCQSPEEKSDMLNKVFDNINSYLKNRDNAGKSLLAFNFMGSDQKEHKSFEIIEIETNQNNTAQANQKELQEISSIIFFAMGLDAKLVGNTPGNVSTGGGTDLRERLLIKQILKSSEQKMLLYPYEVASRFNEWDEHLVWQIQREVVTTLDNSKTGITKSE